MPIKKLKLGICFALLALLALPALATTEAKTAFGQGVAFMEGKDYFAAIEAFKVSAEDPYFPLIDYSYYYIGQSFEETKNFKQAIGVYDIIANYFKNSILVPKALYAKARLEKQELEWDSAAKTYRLLLALYPDHELSAGANFHLAECLESAEKYEDAARIYRNVELNYKKSTFAGLALERLDELAGQKVVANYEARAATIYNLGIRYFQDENMTRAKEYFSRITNNYAKSSFNDEALMMQGRIHLRKGRLERAAKCFKGARNLNKDSKAEAMYYLGRTYMYMESPEAAIGTFNKVIEMFPGSYWAAESLLFMGQNYETEDQIDLALAVYEKLAAYTMTPYQQSQAAWNIGQIKYKKGDYQQAFAAFNQAYRAAPDNATDKQLFWIAKSADKAGLRDEAVASYKKTVVEQDHSYYGYRAREELKRFGFLYSPNNVPDVKESVLPISGISYDLSSHEQKYNLLLSFDLGDEAADEAGFLETKVPAQQKENASIDKYHAYVMKGKFIKPIEFADQKINQAVNEGSLDQIDPRLWRFAYPRGYWQYVEKYAREYGLDPALVYAVIREESRFKSEALSRASAHGLMQIMPRTGRLIANALGLRYSRWNMYQPRVNIQMGCYYLAQTIKRFDGNVSLALAGYNGGPNRVSKWLKKYDHFDLDEFVEDIPLRETRNYVKKVMKSYYGYKRVYDGG